MSKAPSRYSRFLLQVKLHALETVGTLFVLALLTDFALKELHPIIVSIWHTLRAL